MTALNEQTFGGWLKEYYASRMLKKILYKNNPFLAMVPKDEQAAGDTYVMPITYAPAQGISSKFSTAQSNVTSGEWGAWKVTWSDVHGVAEVTNKVVLESRSSEGAFESAVTARNDSILNGLKQEIAFQLYKSGTGSRGQIKTGSTPGTTIELQNKSDIRYFSIGMKLVASATDGGSLGSSETVSVTKLSRETGTLTVDSDVSGLSHAWVAGDYLYREGDAQNGASDPVNAVGLAGWIPDTAPSDTLFGIDRSKDDVLLGGNRVAGAGSIRAGLKEAGRKIYEQGGTPTHAFVHPEDMEVLDNELEANATREMMNLTERDVADIGFAGIKVNSPGGTFMVFSDPNAVQGKGYVVDMSTLVLPSLQGLPHVANMDTLEQLRSASSAALEVRWEGYWNLACNAPGYNAVVTF